MVDRLLRRVVSLTPRIFITDPWQILWVLAMIGLGLATLLTMFSPASGGAAERAAGYEVLRATWAFMFLGGGVSQVIGLQLPASRWEKMGIRFVAVGCAAYSIALFAAGTLPALVLGVLFAIIALGHLGVLFYAWISRRLGGT